MNDMEETLHQKSLWNKTDRTSAEEVVTTDHNNLEVTFQPTNTIQSKNSMTPKKITKSTAKKIIEGNNSQQLIGTGIIQPPPTIFVMQK